MSNPQKNELSDQGADETAPAVSPDLTEDKPADAPIETSAGETVETAPAEAADSEDASRDAPLPEGSDVSEPSESPVAEAADADADDTSAAAADASHDIEQEDEDAEGIPFDVEEEEEPSHEKQWFILKVQVNREDSIRDAIIRRVKIEGLEEHFGDIVVPTEDVVEFAKNGKRRVVKKKLYPGYILANMALTDDTWFIVRETPGVGDFTGSAGKPTPMDPHEVERILRLGQSEEERESQIKTAIPFKLGQRVRVKDGNFQNFEGDVEAIDEANGRITVVITIFNRSTPVELEHYQLEEV